MSGKSIVKRKKGIKSYAGFMTGVAKYMIEPMTRNAYKYALEYLDKRVGEETGELKRGMGWDVRGTVGAVKNSDPKAHLIEWGTGPRYTRDGAYRGEVRPRSFLRAGRNKAMREAKKEYKGALQKAYAEQSR